MFNQNAEKQWNVSLIVVLAVAAIIYLSSILSPPSLMDDVDAVQAQIARTMITTGDWVTARQDGVVYFEKSPLIYWLMAISMKVLGWHRMTQTTTFLTPTTSINLRRGRESKNLRLFQSVFPKLGSFPGPDNTRTAPAIAVVPLNPNLFCFYRSKPVGDFFLAMIEGSRCH